LSSFPSPLHSPVIMPCTIADISAYAEYTTHSVSPVKAPDNFHMRDVDNKGERKTFSPAQVGPSGGEPVAGPVAERTDGEHDRDFHQDTDHVASAAPEPGP